MRLLFFKSVGKSAPAFLFVSRSLQSAKRTSPKLQKRAASPQQYPRDAHPGAQLREGACVGWGGQCHTCVQQLPPDGKVS